MTAADQRKRLKQAFEVIGGVEGLVNEADLVEDGDFQAAAEKTENGTGPRELSAREKAMLRRKSQNNNKMKMTATLGTALKWDLPEAEAFIAVSGSDNALKTLLTLRSNALNANWTVRHGALLGLKSILTRSGMAWDDLLLAVVARDVLSVLVLDRFADFVGDQTVAPVRETAAQVLTLVFTHLKQNPVARKLLWETSLELAQHPDEWQIRHGGLLCIKYLSAVDVRLLAERETLLCITQICREGCQDADEDIRSISVELIGRLLTLEKGEESPIDRDVILGEMIKLLTVCMDDGDLEAHEGGLGVSTLVNAMDLMALLKPHGEAALKIVWLVLCHLRHPSSSVRGKVLTLLGLLDLAQLDMDGAVLLFRMLTQNVLLEDQKPLQLASIKIAETLELKAGPSLLASYVALCTVLLAPLGGPFDAQNFVFVHSVHSDGRANITSTPSAHEIGFKTADVMIIKESAVMEARRLAARLVARIGHLYNVPIHRKIASARVRSDDAYSRTCALWIFGASLVDQDERLDVQMGNDLGQFREWCAQLCAQDVCKINVQRLQEYICQETLPALQQDAAELVRRVGSSSGEMRILLESLLAETSRMNALPVLTSAFPNGIDQQHGCSLAEKLTVELVNVHTIPDGDLAQQLQIADSMLGLTLIDAISNHNLDSVEISLVFDVLLVCIKKTTVTTVAFMIERLVPMFKQAGSHRAVLVMAIKRIFDGHATDISAMAALFLVPVLGRVADADVQVRSIASELLGTLLRLVPLSACKMDPGVSDVLTREMKCAQEFLAQFMGESLEDLRQGGGRRAMSIPEYHLPVPIKADLRPYQRAGVNWLAFLARYGLHGALCDDMGLGKTLQTIAVVASDHYTRTSLDNLPRMTSLIVCPSSLVGHWDHEIKHYAPSLGSPLVYVGALAERKALWSKVDRTEVVITSYETLRSDVALFNQRIWNWIILDEGHVIKNPKTKLTMAVKSLTAEHRLILSGTPIQNNVVELWSLFDFLMPGLLGTEAEFMDKYGKAIMAVQPHVSSNGSNSATGASRVAAHAGMKEFEEAERKLQLLHKQVLPFLLRRMKEDVLKELPPKIIQDYECDPSPIQQILYEDLFGDAAMRRSVAESINQATGPKAPENRHVFQALQYLRKVCVHPKLVMTDDHPQREQVAEVLGTMGASMDDLAVAPKLALLKELLEECGLGSTGDSADQIEPPNLASGHRVLLFAQQKSSLDLVEDIVFQTHFPRLKYLRLDGSVEQRQRFALAQQFNEDPTISVLLLTTPVGGLGLNLTGADTVIFLEHDWNPMRDLQAMDRAHRLGQRRVVTVYRLIVRDTLEQQILGLQSWKRRVAATIVQQQTLTDKDGVRMQSHNLLDLLDTTSTTDPEAAGKRKKMDHDPGMRGWLRKHDALLAADPPLPEIATTEQAEYSEAFDVDTFVQSLGLKQ